jgi:hypothetical protein
VNGLRHCRQVIEYLFTSVAILVQDLFALRLELLDLASRDLTEYLNQDSDGDHGGNDGHDGDEG